MEAELIWGGKLFQRVGTATYSEDFLETLAAEFLTHGAHRMPPFDRQSGARANIIGGLRRFLREPGSHFNTMLSFSPPKTCFLNAFSASEKRRRRKKKSCHDSEFSSLDSVDKSPKEFWALFLFFGKRDAFLLLVYSNPSGINASYDVGTFVLNDIVNGVNVLQRRRTTNKQTQNPESPPFSVSKEAQGLLVGNHPPPWYVNVRKHIFFCCRWFHLALVRNQLGGNLPDICFCSGFFLKYSLCTLLITCRE